MWLLEARGSLLAVILYKENFTGYFISEDWSQNFVVTKVDGLFNCLGVTFPDGLHSANKRPYCALIFTLHMRKSTEHINRGTELVTDGNRSVKLAASVARIDRPLLPKTNAFYFVEKVCFPHQLNLSREPQLDVVGEKWNLKILVSFTCDCNVKRTKIRQSQCENKRRQIARKWSLEFIFALKILFNRKLRVLK
jgi:hypothetical protein